MGSLLNHSCRNYSHREELRYVESTHGDAYRSKRKMGSICGKEKAPVEIDPKYNKWYVANQKVKSWLLTSMTLEIMKRYICLKTVKEIWDALSTTLFDGTDEVQVFTLNQKAFATKQNGKSLTNYFGELIAIFQELDHRDTIVMSFDRDIKAHAKSIERLRVYILLAGFDVEFDQVRGEILRKDPILGFREFYAYVRCEADRREAMKNEVAQSEVVAMVGRRPSQTRTGHDHRTC